MRHYVFTAILLTLVILSVTVKFADFAIAHLPARQ